MAYVLSFGHINSTLSISFYKYTNTQVCDGIMKTPIVWKKNHITQLINNNTHGNRLYLLVMRISCII